MDERLVGEEDVIEDELLDFGDLLDDVEWYDADHGLGADEFEVQSLDVGVPHQNVDQRTEQDVPDKCPDHPIFQDHISVGHCGHYVAHYPLQIVVDHVLYRYPYIVVLTKYYSSCLACRRSGIQRSV